MIKIDQNYTDYRDDSDPKYPGGKAVNATTSEGTDGTPLLADWMNDVNGALQAIFIEAFGNIDKVSGKPDNVQESDVLKSIKKITQEYTDQINAVEGKARAQGDASTLSSAKKYTDNMLIKIFQNGYIQWPGMKSPLEDTALHFEGYSWYEVNYDGNFFRAKGRNAKAFSSKKLTIEQIRNGDYIFQDDEQGDAIRNIEGTVALNAASTVLCASGVFSKNNNNTGTHADWGWVGDQKPFDRLIFNLNGVVPIAEENRARNLTFTIWVLVKD